MAYTKSALGYSDQGFEGASEVKRHFNPIDRTANVLESARSLAGRVEDMCVRFIGPYPAEAEGPNPPSGPGLFQALTSVSEDTANALRRANEALDRLEKELA